jgi:hypothetical protein
MELLLLLLMLSHGACSHGPRLGFVGADGPKRWQKAAVQSLECPGNAGRRASTAKRDQPQFCYRASLPAASPHPPQTPPSPTAPDRMALLTTSAPVNYDEQEGVCARAASWKLQLTVNSRLC